MESLIFSVVWVHDASRRGCVKKNASGQLKNKRADSIAVMIGIPDQAIHIGYVLRSVCNGVICLLLLPGIALVLLLMDYLSVLYLDL